MELGSPLAAVVQAWATSLAAQRVVDWGEMAFHVKNVQVVEPPAFTASYARLCTTTPVVMKGSGRDVEGQRVTRQAWLLPTDAEFPVYFIENRRVARNCRIAAKTNINSPRLHHLSWDLPWGLHCPYEG